MSGKQVDGYLRIPKNEPEYYFAERKHALYCNLIDANDKKYIPDVIVEKALEFIYNEIEYGRNRVFIVCNHGVSRSPSIAFMYLIREGYFDRCATFEDAFKRFKAKYPMYSPNKGFYDYTEMFFYKERGHEDG